MVAIQKLYQTYVRLSRQAVKVKVEDKSKLAPRWFKLRFKLKTA